MKKTLAAGLVIFAFAFSSVPLASAQTMSAADEQALIQALQAQILVLIQQINAILAQRGTTPIGGVTPGPIVSKPLAGPSLVVSSNFVSFNWTPGDPTISPVSLSLFNQSTSQPIHFKISVPNQPAWLNAGYATNTLTIDPSGVMGMGVSVDPTKLSPGTYTYSIGLVGDFANSPATINVTLTVRSATGATVAPTVNINASPSTVSYGQGTTLSWSSTNATDCYSNFGGPNGSTHLTPNGSVYQGPLNQTFTYSISCVGATGQRADKDVTVTYAGVSAPSLDFSASTNSIVAGAYTPVTLSWNSSGATSCLGVQGWYGASVGTNGTSLVSPTNTTTYTISCSNNAGQTVSKSVTVNVTQPTPVGTVQTGFILVNGSHTNNQTLAYNATPTISWNVSGASSCSLKDANGTYSYLQPGSASVTLSNPPLTKSTTFTVSCDNGAYDALWVNVSPNTATGGTTVGGTVTNTGSTDPYTGASYSQTGSPLASNERTVTYTYPSSPCGSLMSQYATPGSVSVGNGPVYTAASQICSPNTSTFRTYSCYNSSVNGSIQGTATFAFQCNAPASSATTGGTTVGGATTGGATTQPPINITLTAYGSSGSVTVPAGSTFALQWGISSNGQSVSCSDNFTHMGAGNTTLSGFLNMQPVTGPTTYTITCNGATGNSKTASVTVTPSTNGANALDAISQLIQTIRDQINSGVQS